MALKFNGVEPKEIKYKGTDLTVLKYNVKAYNLEGKINRPVLSYSKATLDSYVGLTNASWDQVENASALTKYGYYYIRVLVTDTNRYADFCVQVLFYNNKTIDTNNIGWGYEGEIIGTIPFWGKHQVLSFSFDNNSLILGSVERLSSPNQHARTGYLTFPTFNPDIYYGDRLRIFARPKEHYEAVIKIDGAQFPYVGYEATDLIKDITVTNSNVSMVLTGRYVPYMHTLWTGTHSSNVQNKKAYFQWPVTLPLDVTSVSIDAKFSFRGHDVSGTYTVNTSGSVASEFIKHSGVSKTTVTISWFDSSGYYFESTGNNYSATAYIYAIRCVY